MPTLKSTFIAGSMILVASFTALAQTTATATYAYNGLPLPILTDSADTITVASITVPRALKMTKVTAQIQIQYPNTGDLNVYLYSPQGTRTKLLEHNCSIANVDTTFDDAAPQIWRDFCPTEAGRGPFRGNEPLSNFNNDNSSFGVWRLAIENDVSNDRSGWITSVSLTITGTTQVSPISSAQTIVNTASGTGAGTAAPGELISILGAGLGPTTAVAAPAGALPTTLGGTTVTINGTAAPISYTSPFRVDVQVPFFAVPGTTIAVQVNYNNQTSPVATLNVVTAVPGIYTASTPGQPGPAKAINQAGTLNSAVNPAPKGSVISIYASGLGVVNPPGTAGAVPPNNPLSTVSGDVGAFIGGVPAVVQFAGLAPGSPALYQINIMVPASAASGTQQLLLYSNGIASQSGITVVIQ
ncbi:MAG TPA: proprotein convertase P-domain-containing protein [Bryobacteraceae bacterium]|nr:proprotein convertase P-domain-containing protein [Bryobacteraceae bacterium]